MARVNYRMVTLFASLAGAILSSIALAFLVTSLIRYRAEDFFTASTTTDFATLGTCVETLTHDQLKALDYNNADIDCGKDVDRGNALKLSNTLRATVHGVYYAYHTGQVDDGTNTGTMVDASSVHDPGEFLRTVMAAQVAHVLGKTAPFFTEGEDGTQKSFVNVGLNFTQVYKALKLVSEVDVLATCEDIYSLTYADIGDTNDLVDTEHEAFIKAIRAGRLDDELKTKSKWPLQEFVLNCPGVPSSPGRHYVPAGQASEETPLTSDHIKYMYAHCVAQFQFASVGTSAWEGTYGIPLPGIEPGPSGYWYPQAEGFNSTSPYTTRARMYLGQRFGMSVWAYVPMFLATCFLLGDSIVFFFAEALMPITIADQVNFASDGLTNTRDSLVIASTKSSSRRKRLAIGFVAVLTSILFYTIFVVAPWGFFYTNMPRPICERSDDTATAVGSKPDHGVPLIYWHGTKGGWRTDYDATWYDLMAIFLQLFVLFLLPLTTTSMCRNVNKSVQEASGGRTTDSGLRDAAQRVQNDAGYKFTQRVLVLPLIVGIVIILVGQSVSGARFGMAWAEGVVAQELNAEKDGWLFDEVAISEQVYDQTIATLAATTACGLIFAVAMQRHLINGVGCFSAGLFFGWCALVVVFGLPLVFYAMSRSIFIEGKATEDCATFPRSSHEFENNLCISRFWTFLVGGGIFTGTVLVMTTLGLLEAFPALFANRKTAWVPIPQVQEESSIMRVTGPATRSSGSSFQNATEPFFGTGSNPRARATTSTNFLYSGKLKVPAPRR